MSNICTDQESIYSDIDFCQGKKSLPGIRNHVFGISKRDIIAQKTLTVEDVKRTEQHRKEVAQKIEPVMAPAEDEFIKTNLQTLQTSIMQIRKKDVSDSVKTEELGILFDLSDNSKRAFIINFLLRADENSLHEVFDKANLTLANVLREGITEKDYEKDNIKTHYTVFKTI